MSTIGSTETIEALAAEIGEVVYLDVAKWHLYLNDAKLHIPVAQRLYPLLAEGDLTEDAVQAILADIPITLGAGRRQVPLRDLIPTGCMGDLMRALEDFRNRY